MEDSLSQANVNSSLHYAQQEMSNFNRGQNEHTDEHEPGQATIN